MTPITIAPPLREVAALKIAEFEQLKHDFKTRYGIGSPHPADVSVRERLAALIKDIQRFDAYLEEDDDLTIIASYVEQAGDDSCMSDDKLLKYEAKVLEKLHKRMNRYDATSLHLVMVREAMSAAPSVKASNTGIDTLSLDDFEVVDNKLELLWEEFEAQAFTDKDIDVDALETYLTGLLEGNGSLSSLSRLRDNMRRYGEEVLDGEADIEEDELEWCIMDLLKNDLVNEETKKTLEKYIQNQVAIKELLGVLNMKSIRDWNWKKGDKGLPVTARQDVEGRYHVAIEEDIIDMLFLHCTAIGWAQKLKGCLSDYFRYLDLVYKRHLTLEESQEREFFLEMMPPESPPDSPPDSPDYRIHACSPPPPPPPPLPAANWGFRHGVYVTSNVPLPTRKRGKKKNSKIMHEPFAVLPPPPPPPPPPMMIPPPPPPPMHMMIPPPPPPPMPVVIMPPPPPPPGCAMAPMPPILSILETVDDERHRVYKRDFFMSRLPTQNGCRPKVTSVEEVQANLIKTMAAEIKVRSALDGQVSCSVIDFHSLATALPHKTVLVVMKVLGVPEVFLDFFARFLGADLNIGPSVRGTRDRVRARACGVPERHGMELLFTEAVMFFAELAVSEKTGSHLYRLGSRCYFVGSEEQNDQALQELATFSRHTNLDFDDVLPQPGRVDIGFLQLSGDAVVIKDSQVKAFASRVKKQLAAQSTVYDWVRVWNNMIGTYAAHLFGPLIDLFGRPHFEAVKAAYKRIFDTIFEGSNLTDHIRSMLRARSDFALNTSPLALEAFIYLPFSFGGLGVKNPLITLNLARNIVSDSASIINDYREVEQQYHQTALTNWSALDSTHITKKLLHVFAANDDAINASLGPWAGDPNFPTPFLSLPNLTRHRDYALYPHLPPSLLHPTSPFPIPPPPDNLHIPYPLGLYQTLLNAPVETISASERLRQETRDCGSMKRWDQLESQERWVLAMYGEECLDVFGSLDVWCERYVPGVCVVLLKGLGENGDDDGTESDMTSV
ncbi:hypothetical protein SVAN01_10693 [Stagonosporopsis vannaccii]|nr:hypothetical protein SVAN01_10693 [Stagonosporopsis vannaccii]